MKKALIVVDYQNDFVDGALGFEGAELLDDKIAKKIKQYRAEGGEIIFTFDTHQENYLETMEGKKLPFPHCIEGTQGWQLYGQVALAREAEDKCFEKYTYGSLDLGNYLKAKAYEQIELCGLVSSICVLSNAVIAKAACPDATIIVDRKLTDSFDKEMNEKTFDILENIHLEII